ncbi:MAG: hypothetical protein KAR38_10875, partial [Calditrichia bacterium]|nr:hypothetical protein [Calditrichia bacterium]
MKKLILFLLVLTIIVLTGCKDSTKSNDNKVNEVSFTLNGAQWENEKFSLEMPSFNEFGASYYDSTGETNAMLVSISPTEPYFMVIQFLGKEPG